MSTSTDFSGLWIPLITPFSAGVIDLPALKKLVRRLRADGVHGLVVCGTTGEAAALDDHEQLRLLDTVLGCADGLPVVMGVAGANQSKVCAWLKQVDQHPLAGVLVSAPHTIRPSQEGLTGWFTTLADLSRVPVLIYDIPYRTGATLQRDTLLALAEHPNIAAVKDCGGDPGKTLALIAQGRLQVLAGEDLQIFSTLALGGRGAIAASAHLATDQFVRLIRLLQAGALHDARVLWHALVPWIESVFAQPNPAPIKAMLAHLGEVDAQLRAPLVPVSIAHLGSMQRLHQRLCGPIQSGSDQVNRQ